MMSEPGSKDDDLEQLSLWQLLNTPIGDINRQTASRAEQNVSRYASDSPKQLDQNDCDYDDAELDLDDDSEFVNKRIKTKPERRLRGFAKRHSAKESQNPNRKQHNFRDTTKKVGFHADFESSPIGQSDTRAKSDGKTLYKPGFFTLALGVILPLAAMAFENSTHYMAQTAFDPFPTPNHLLLFSLIPISNFLNWLAVRRNLAPFYSIISLSTGMALGIAILYSVMLLPFTPQFALQTLMGGGILGLAPLLSIPVTMLCGNTICQLADRQKTFFDAHQLKHLGHTIILVMVLAVELPSTLTRMHISAADQGDPQAIPWLRQWGSQDVLLRACYERSGEATDILGTLADQQHPVSVNSARDIFYRVTGVSFNSVPLPASFRGTIKHAGLIEDPAGLNDGVKDEFDLDPDIAGELVSGVARGLSVSNSDITGSLDTFSGVASLDWNFTFENVSTVPREARAKILLPPNAVVTKATLWLDDLQRETVIQERDLARNTYVQSVTSHKRDPLLVSMAGKDSVLVQCYPVVKGTKTKIRLHIVAPLIVANRTEESLVMPTFEERNFAITIPHKIDLSSKSKISLTGTDSQTSGHFTQLKKELDNSVMSRFEAVARVAMADDEGSQPITIRPPQSIAELHKEFFSLLPKTAISPRVGEMSLNDNSSPHRSLTVLIDKSVSMSPYIADIVKGLRSSPKSLPITILEVNDGSNLVCKNAHSDQPEFQKLLDALSESKCVGGQTDGNALTGMLEDASPLATPVANRSDILWIHAAQPNANFNVEVLRNTLLSHESEAAALYDLQVASGPNAILPESYDYPRLHRIVRTGLLADDISTFIENYSKNQIRRPATTFGIKPTGTTTGANTDLAQVQAYKLAMARYQAGDKWGAYELAARYHLVTPVSSAVVTEEAPIEANKNAELAEKKAIDELEWSAKPPVAEPSPQPVSDMGRARFSFQHNQFEVSKKESNRRQTKLDKVKFYNAPMQIQIAEDRPVITDFRSSGDSSYTSSDSLNSRESLATKQLPQGKALEEGYSRFQQVTPQRYAAKDKEYNRDAIATGGSYGDAFSSQSASGGGGNNETYANTAGQTSSFDAPYPSHSTISPPPSGVTTAATLEPTGRIAGRMLVPSSAPGMVPASPVPERNTSDLMGATNGTVGPQAGDANSKMSRGNSFKCFSFPKSSGNFIGGKKQLESRAKRRIDADRAYSDDSVQQSPQPPAITLSSPFSGVMTKLNSLSSAAGSAAPGYSGAANPYGQGFGQGSSAEFEQREKDLEPYGARKQHGYLDATTPAIFIVGAALIFMLMIFFRLLAKMKNESTPKGPIQ